MAVVDSQREVMDAIIAYFTDVKGYIDDVGQPTPDFYTYVENLSTTDLEEYLLGRMSYTPTYVESAVQEALNFCCSWTRDMEVRRMSRADLFSDASSSLDNDVRYWGGLKELQTAYLQGRTPQQRN